MNSRAIAAKVLIRVLQEHQSLTATLDAVLATVPLPKDKAFIQAISYGVLRQYYALDALLSLLTPKPLKAKDLEIKLLALIGLYQLKYMRVKDYAAVSATVNAAKRQPWAKALLNALFRRYLREQDSLDTQIGKHPNHPQWLIDRIQQDWPDEVEQILEANNQQPPLSLRINQLKNTPEQFREKLANAALTMQSCAHSPVGITLEHALPVEQIPDFTSGCVSVQDQAAQLAAFLLEVQPGQRVLDLCAAPGGKTAHILETQPELQELWALDSDDQRLQRVSENLNRLGLQATVKVGDAASLDWWDGRLFERVLIDAPCSALGVIRRHPDIKFLRLPEDIAALQTLQLTILEQAWQVLAPGGILIYATCSILKAENEQQIQTFLSRHADAGELEITANWESPQAWGAKFYPVWIIWMGFIMPGLLNVASIKPGKRLASFLLLLNQIIVLGFFWGITNTSASGFQTVIKQAEVNLVDELYVLQAELEFSLSPSAKEALLKGIALTWDIPIIIKQKRPLLWDKEIKAINLRYQIRYYALLNIYRVKAEHNQQLNNFATLPTALQFMATLIDIPLIDAADLPEDGEYHVDFKIDFERNALPIPLRPITYFDREWFLSSETFVCSLPK